MPKTNLVKDTQAWASRNGSPIPYNTCSAAPVDALREWLLWTYEAEAKGKRPAAYLQRTRANVLAALAVR